MSIDKQFHGDLDATSKGQMLAVQGEVKGSDTAFRDLRSRYEAHHHVTYTDAALGAAAKLAARHLRDYRLPDSAGYFAGSYRFLTSQGTGTSNFDGAAFFTMVHASSSVCFFARST